MDRCTQNHPFLQNLTFFFVALIFRFIKDIPSNFVDIQTRSVAQGMSSCYAPFLDIARYNMYIMIIYRWEFYNPFYFFLLLFIS